MSFASSVKEEISRTDIGSIEEASPLLYAVFSSIGVVGLSSAGMQLKVSFENRPAARCICVLLERFFGEKCGIAVKNSNLNGKKIYELTLEGREKVMGLLSTLGFEEGSIFLSHTPDKDLFDDDSKRIGFLKGLFLSCGTVSHPRKNYQAEFVLQSKEFADWVRDIMLSLGLQVKSILRKKDYVLYLKGGDNVSAMLSLLGAYTSLLEFENVRAYKDIRNNTNRAANCELANFTKTYGSAQRYLEMIDLIDETVGLSSLSETLVEAAELRREYPESSLSELSEISGISKSALNHRMRKIKQIATGIKEETR